MRNSILQGEWTEKQPPRNLANLVKQLRDVSNQQERVHLKVQTTDATVTEIWSEIMPLNCHWHLTYMIHGRDTSGNRAQYHESKQLKRGSSGAPTVAATTTHEFAYEDVAAWGFTVTYGTDGLVTVSVNGAVATTIDWEILVTLAQVPRITTSGVT